MWKWVFLETQLSPSSTLVCSHVPGVFSSCPTNFLPSSGFIRWSWKVPPSIQNEPVGQKCAERPYRGVDVDKPHVDKVKCLLWIECVLFFNCPTLPIFYHPFINLCPFSSIHFSILRPFSVRSSLSQPNIFFAFCSFQHLCPLFLHPSQSFLYLLHKFFWPFPPTCLFL